MANTKNPDPARAMQERFLKGELAPKTDAVASVRSADTLHRELVEDAVGGLKGKSGAAKQAPAQESGKHADPDGTSILG